MTTITSNSISGRLGSSPDNRVNTTKASVTGGTQTGRDSVDSPPVDINKNRAAQDRDAPPFKRAMADIYTILILFAKLLNGLKGDERKAGFEAMLRMIDLTEIKVDQMKAAATKEFMATVIQSAITIVASAYQVGASGKTLSDGRSKMKDVSSAKKVLTESPMPNDAAKTKFDQAEAVLKVWSDKLSLKNGIITGVTDGTKAVGSIAGGAVKLQADHMKAEVEIQEAFIKFIDSLSRMSEKQVSELQASLDKVQETFAQYTQKWNAMGLKGAEHV